MFTICRLHGIVDENMYLKLEKTIQRMIDSSKKELLLHIYSIGGQNEWAMKIHALLYRCREHNIETYAIGYKTVHSAALIIYLSCAFRIAYEETQFLIHNVKAMAGESLSDICNAEKEAFEYFSKVTTVETSTFYSLAAATTYLTYDEAKQYKIINFDYKKGLLN